MNNTHIVTLVTTLFIITIFSAIYVIQFPVPNSENTPDGYQSIELYNAHEKYVSEYLNYYKMGQNINITIGSTIPIRFQVITCSNFDGVQSFQYITREHLLYNGIISGSPIVSMNSEWDGASKTLSLDTDVTFKIGAGSFKVISYNHSSIILKVIDWNPSIYDYRLGA
jgi:hypothetical protein